MRVAIMQPYFFPYAGYFRLFAHTDLFVIYDCVQFPRRGWVHRNRIMNGGREQWITLPLQKCGQSTLIRDLKFRPDADTWFETLLAQNPVRHASNQNVAAAFAAIKPAGGVVDYLEATLQWSCSQLSIPFRSVRSSQLKVAPDLRGQDRILAICQQVGAREYVNSPGGRSLYQAEAFAAKEIELRFLNDWRGSSESLLPRLLKENPAAVAEEILAG